MRSSWVKWLLLCNAEVWCWYPNFIEYVSFDVGVRRFTIRTQIEVGTVRAMPPDTTDGLAIAAIASNATVNDALMPGTVFRYMIQCPLKRLTFRIAYDTIFPIASLGRWNAFQVVDDLP